MIFTEIDFNKTLQWYLDRGSKIEDMREDIKLREYAVKLGYTVKYGNNFGDPLTFEKGNRIIWSTPYVYKNILYNQWRCSDIINERFFTPITFQNLKTALDQEWK
jgi:hypothetical protein